MRFLYRPLWVEYGARYLVSDSHYCRRGIAGHFAGLDAFQVRQPQSRGAAIECLLQNAAKTAAELAYVSFISAHTAKVTP